MPYKKDCPVCIGEELYDIHCPYCDDNMSKSGAFRENKKNKKVTAEKALRWTCPHCGSFQFISMDEFEDNSLVNNGKCTICCDNGCEDVELEKPQCGGNCSCIKNV